MIRHKFFLLLWLIVICIAPTQARSQDRILSDEDPRYKALEELQQLYCEAQPTHLCSVPPARCKVLAELLSSNLFPGDEATLAQLKLACSLRATRYEPAGVHWLLKDRFTTVQRIADALGKPLQTSPIYGALPIRSINAALRVETTPIFIMNLRFFEFANEFSKVCAQSIPVSNVGGQLAFDTSEAATNKRIASVPMLRDQFMSLLDHFLDIGPGGHLQPDHISKTVQVVYTEAMEVFAFAHEYGHLYLGHNLPNSLTNARTIRLPPLLQEIEADVLALQLMLAFRNEKTADAQENPFFASLLHGVEFFFVVRQIVEEARAIRAGAPHQKFTLTDSTDFVRRTVECISQPACRLSDVSLPSSNDMSSLNDHPSHALRASIVRELIEKVPPRRHADFVAVAELVNRNAGLLWTAVKQEYQKK